MGDYIFILLGIGVALLLMSGLPTLSQKIKVSYPIFLILIGCALYFIELPIPWPDPWWPDKWLVHISEWVVIISLMGAGLKIGRNFSFRAWRVPLRLVFFTMPLCMVAVFFLGKEFLSLSIPAALLLAAVLAPTDPVLAAEVQLEDPKQYEQNEKAGKHERLQNVRFPLTAEAGLNDGLAFPFTILAVGVAKAGSYQNFDLFSWILDDLLLKIIIGIGMGWVLGLFFRWTITKIASIGRREHIFGFIAIAATLTAYSLTEVCHGYGFLAVFACGMAMRKSKDEEVEAIERIHRFAEESEHLILVAWLILFGGSIMSGLLSFATWPMLAAALVIVLLVRPIAGLLSLIGSKLQWKQKLVTSFFGIRGVGSIFYLAWACVEFDFAEKQTLYIITALVILCSILTHGLTAPRIGQFLGNEKNG